MLVEEQTSPIIIRIGFTIELESSKATAMYRHLLEQNIGNGYLLKVEGIPHCIAWWTATRDEICQIMQNIFAYTVCLINGERVMARK